MQEEKINNEQKMPLVALRGSWVFPGTLNNIDVGRIMSKRAIEQCLSTDSKIFLVNQKNVMLENPTRDDLYDIGTICTIRQHVNLQNGLMRVVFSGENRARLKRLDIENGFFNAVYEELETYENDDEDFLDASRKMIIDDISNYLKLDNYPNHDKIIATFSQITDVELCCDMITGYLDLEEYQYYEILEELNLKDRIKCLHSFINKQIKLKKIWQDIDNEVQTNIDNNQKEYYLRTKMMAIRNELSSEDDYDEIEEYEEKINKLKLKKDLKKPLFKELKRLKSMPESSPDYGVIRTYLDFVLDMPWSKSSKDSIDIKKAEEILNQDHYGLLDVKERIIESIAVKKKRMKATGSIICLVGPPGVGKTSIVKSIAKSLNRKFVSMRLGGVTDENEIRGHRKTYVGAMSGRIISLIANSGVNNPVMLLDEIDKLGNDFRGDPSSALLEVLDPEQNNEFIDRYLEVPFDLSNVFFITTANDQSQIPDALYDRLEIIEISGYTQKEKFEIAKRYLIDKQKKEHGIKEDELKISDTVIEILIKNYTREAGVRNLERLIAKIMRKSCKKLLEGKTSIRITRNNYKEFVGKHKYFDDELSKTDQVGVVNGLAWTEVGGTILTIEANTMSGKGDVKLTGSLGDVMKESGQAAITYIRSNAKKYKIDENFYENTDIHVHAPENAVPKDGPSAGITMTCAIVSALTGKKVRNDIAMTGELTIRGRVLPIGGLKEKALAAFSYGIKNVIIPFENQRDIEDIPEEIRKQINFIPVKKVEEVLEKTLL